MGAEGPMIAKYVGDFIKKELDNYLHRRADTAQIIPDRAGQRKRERKAMAGVTATPEKAGC